MSKNGWTVMQCLGLFVLVGSGQAVIRGLMNRGTELLWGAFDWLPGGWNGQLMTIGGITIVAVLFTFWAYSGGAKVAQSESR